MKEADKIVASNTEDKNALCLGDKNRDSSNFLGKNYLEENGRKSFKYLSNCLKGM